MTTLTKYWVVKTELKRLDPLKQHHEYWTEVYLKADVDVLVDEYETASRLSEEASRNSASLIEKLLNENTAQQAELARVMAEMELMRRR